MHIAKRQIMTSKTHPVPNLIPFHLKIFQKGWGVNADFIKRMFLKNYGQTNQKALNGNTKLPNR